MLLPQGEWWIGILLTGSAPLLFVASVVAMVFPKEIIARPAAWSIGAAVAAVSISLLALWFVTGTWVGGFSVIVAVPATAAFCWLMRAWKAQAFNPTAD
jgi:hypothetical protein